MRLQAIVHQQICQLRWHILACLGLVMVLPIEEAIVNLREGDGFHSFRMVCAAIAFSPLLAGLIACANVQGDLSEKRYIFWRSKPANVKKLMALKFFVGLIVSLAIIACPLIFAVVTTALCGEDFDAKDFEYFLPIAIVVAVMTYSLCFGCNVLVRKTARSWLIGMLLAGFVLVSPLVLPLGYKDIVSDIGLWVLGFYPATMLSVSVAAFVFALYAAQHDWHLRTNLKSLLWVGAGLVFVLLMLFSSQVANIKVLQEKQIEYSYGRRTLNYAGSQLIFKRQYIDIDKNNISFSNISGEPDDGIIHKPRIDGYRSREYLRTYKKAGNDVYSLSICTYSRREFYRREGNRDLYKEIYEKTYLKSHRFTGESETPVSELDISDCLTDRKHILRRAMRLIDNAIVVCVNDSCIVADVTDSGELKRIDTKIGVFMKTRLPDNTVLWHQPPINREHRKEFAIPLVPVEGISIEERIKLSIDLNYQYYYYYNEIHESSIVDVHDGKIAFFFVNYDGIARFDVTGWDQEKIYCRSGVSRPFTILENVTGTPASYDRKFVKNGKFYCYDYNTLLVFDIRSNRRIRKLGHFVRMDYNIQDIGVFENGNILLCTRWGPEYVRDLSEEQKNYLYLLKNPE